MQLAIHCFCAGCGGKMFCCQVTYYTGPPSVVIWLWNMDCYSKGCQENNSSRDEIYENSRILFETLQNKFTICKEIRKNTISIQTIAIKVEVDTWQTAYDNETLLPNWHKEPWQTAVDASRYVRHERVNKWPNSMTDMMILMMITAEFRCGCTNALNYADNSVNGPA